MQKQEQDAFPTYCSSDNSLLAVHPAEVAVPPNADHVGEEQPVLQRQEGEVDELHSRPDHPVGLEGRPPGGLELLLGAVALHGGHTAEEDTDHDGRETKLVAGDAADGGETRVGGVDATGEEVEPGVSYRAEND